MDELTPFCKCSLVIWAFTIYVIVPLMNEVRFPDESCSKL